MVEGEKVGIPGFLGPQKAVLPHSGGRESSIQGTICCLRATENFWEVRQINIYFSWLQEIFTFSTSHGNYTKLHLQKVSLPALDCLHLKE
jgi:hypothetical protein